MVSLRRLVPLMLLAGMLMACVAGNGSPGSVGPDRNETAGQTPSWPRTPPVRVCGNSSLLGDGPRRPPKGAVVVHAGDNGAILSTRPGTTFWFAPGIHTLGGGEYSQIVPGAHSRYVGAPGAVLDGRRFTRYAFAGSADHVTIEFLTIQNFGPVGGNNGEGVTNHEGARDWTFRYNTIRWNAGAGLTLGSDNIAQYNCLSHNGEYGFDAFTYSPQGPVRLVFDHNEVSFNNTYDWEAKREACGCTGGGKFWSVTDATVTNNYVHDNKGPGLWADTNNSGFLIAHNYIADNEGVGIIYEIGYNSIIRENAIIRNGLVAGRAKPGFPTGGIYVSESGADERVQSQYRGKFEIVANLLRDDWSGVVLWENADRFCGSPGNTSAGSCTLVNPAVTVNSCNPSNIVKSPYFWDCRWRTQNVKVHDNRFELSPIRIGRACSLENYCGVNSIISNYGTWPDWSPYRGALVENAITYKQNNTFYDNTYVGTWGFVPLRLGNIVTFAAWRGDPYHQDAGSTMSPDSDRSQG